jgi:hypothetical protein
MKLGRPHVRRFTKDELDGGDGTIWARARAADRVRVRMKKTAPNRYDGWDPRFCIASDEPMVQKYERRSNHRCTSALG